MLVVITQTTVDLLVRLSNCLGLKKAAQDLAKTWAKQQKNKVTSIRFQVASGFKGHEMMQLQFAKGEDLFLPLSKPLAKNIWKALQDTKGLDKAFEWEG